MRDFDVRCYQPALRLADREKTREDNAFLQGQPGYRPEIGRAWKRARRRALKLYLSSLSRDFHRLHAQARALVADATVEQSHLVGVLLRQKWQFYRVRTILEFRLVLLRFNIGQVDLQPLLDLLQEMQVQLHPPQVSPAAG
jgi:hypothetical protein